MTQCFPKLYNYCDENSNACENLKARYDNTSPFAKKVHGDSLKSDADKLEHDKLENCSTLFE